MDRADVVILMDGGLAGAIACAMECERGLRVVACQAPPAGAVAPSDRAPLDGARAAALVREQAELYGAVELLQGAAGVDGHADATALLLDAARAAGARGARRVVWALACGESIDEMFRVTERADLVGRLAALDADDRASPALRIETPFVDLTHDQLLDLARDLEIPDGIWAARPSAPPHARAGRSAPPGGSAVA